MRTYSNHAAAAARDDQQADEDATASSLFTASPASVEIILQDDRGGRRIELLPCAAASRVRVTASRLSASRLVSRSSSVTIGNRRHGRRAPRRMRPPAVASVGGAVETRRQADDDRGEAVVLARRRVDAARDALDGVRGARHRERVERPRKRAGRIADRQPDPPRADVDAEHPHHRQML